MSTTSSLAPARTGAVLRGYVALTKPRVIELLLVTTVPVMVLAQGALPNLWLVLATVAGGTLSAGSANTFNMVIDRDIDTVMGRTQSRPLVTGGNHTACGSHICERSCWTLDKPPLVAHHTAGRAAFGRSHRLLRFHLHNVVET